MRFKQPKACGICGSTKLNKFGASNKTIIVCLACNARWWNIWRTKEEHDKWMEKTEVE
jgi:hypothetical protein